MLQLALRCQRHIWQWQWQTHKGSTFAWWLNSHTRIAFPIGERLHMKSVAGDCFGLVSRDGE